MSARHFECVTEKAEGRSIRTYRLTCGHCGRTENMGNQNMGERTAQPLVSKKFTSKGWIVGRRPQDDRCPGCANAIYRANAKKKLRVVHNAEKQDEPMPYVSFAEAQVALKAAHPREMTRDERRLIFAKLDEVFLDEKRGYDNGWSDKRVSDDLGVPRAWVAQIRDENFGPSNTNTEAQELVVDAKKAQDAMAEAFAEWSKAKAEIDAKVEKLMQTGAAIQKRLDKIEAQF